MADAEAEGQRGERAVGQIRQVGRVVQQIERTAQAQQRIGRQRCGRDVGVDRFDVEHPVDVCAAQHEHLVHAGLRGDAGELCLHVFEQRAFGFGAHVMQLEPEVAKTAGLDHLHLRVGMGEHIFARLAEELVGERHVLGVDVMHLRGVGNIGRTVPGAGGDDRGDRTIEARPQGFECRFHAAASTRPAAGPGV